MLSDALSSLKKTADDFGSVERARLLLVRYAIKVISSKTFRKRASSFTKVMEEALLSIKRKIDSNEYFLSRLWRAMHTIVRYSIKIPIACKEYNVPVDEILLTFEILDSKDIEVVSKSRINISRLNRNDREDLSCSISEYANTLINRRVGSPRFIARNDSGISLEDIKKELIEEGERLILFYERFGDVGKIMNFAKRGMHNRCVNFIKYHVAKCRCSIVNVNDPNRREFLLTKISIDSKVDDEDDERAISEVLEGRSSDRPDYIFEQKSVMLSIYQKVPSNVCKFVEIVVGNKIIPDFTRWVSLRHGNTKFYDDYYKLGELAMEYLGITKEEVMRHVCPHLGA